MTTPARALRITERRSADGVALILEGVIDESLETERLAQLLTSECVAIDLDLVRRVSSPGVREWKNALSMASARYVGLVRCRPAFVNQLNWVTGFSGPAQLISFYLPYLCDACATEFEVLVDVRRAHSSIAALEAPAQPCPHCKGEATLDALAASYLHFAAGQPRPSPPPAFDRVLGGGQQRPTAGFKVRKVVEETWTGLDFEGELDGADHFRRLEEGLEAPLLVSLTNVTSVATAGEARLANFLSRLPSPSVVDGVPLDLAQRLAARTPPLALQVFRVRAPFRCALHGPVTLALEWKALTSAEHECERCGQLLSSSFDPGALAAPFPSARSTPELEGVIAALHAPSSPRAAVPAGEVGSLVMSRYLVLRQLGVGGMAEVLLAKSRAPGGFEKLLVVKRALPRLRADQAFIELFLSEARLAGRLNHPNIVQVYDVGRDGDEYFIIMEYVNGVDLGSVLKRAKAASRPSPIGVALKIAAEILSGLRAAHEHLDDRGSRRPIVHHDVSPQNVLVSHEGHVKLTDFGVARVATAERADEQLLRGKVPYQAPETLTGGPGALGPSVDLFAAGVVLYQLLTLEHPFVRASDAETLGAILSASVRAPSSLRPDCPPSVDALVLGLLERDPGRRLGPAAAAIERIEALLLEHRLGASSAHISTWLDDVLESPTGG